MDNCTLFVLKNIVRSRNPSTSFRASRVKYICISPLLSNISLIIKLIVNHDPLEKPFNFVQGERSQIHLHKPAFVEYIFNYKNHTSARLERSRKVSRANNVLKHQKPLFTVSYKKAYKSAGLAVSDEVMKYVVGKLVERFLKQ